MRRTMFALFLTGVLGTPFLGEAQGPRRPPLSADDVDAIARLVMMEDQRQFDGTQLASLVTSRSTEIRRRAAITIARLADQRGIAVLRLRPLDADTAVAASTVFAIGQLRDTTLVPWLDSLVTNPATPAPVLTEAVVALGKLRSAQARDALARFLARASAGTRTNQAIGDALLSLGRFTIRSDLAPITRWTTSRDEEIRWRATWALFRPRDPASVQHLLVLSKDPSAYVRSWAVRGLSKPQADTALLTAQARATLLAATNDPDRRVRSEAIRALSTFRDSVAVSALVSALQSSDTWISASAADSLASVGSPMTVPMLKEAAGPGQPCALRIVATSALNAFAPDDGLEAAFGLARDTVPHCRSIATQTLTRALSPPPSTTTGRGNAAPRPTLTAELRERVTAALSSIQSARRAELSSPDLLTRIAAIRAVMTWGDSTDLSALRALSNVSQTASAALTAVTTIERRLAGTGGRGGGRGNTAEGRTMDFYRRIVERWVVPDYNGSPRPRSIWTTPRGEFEIELYPGDAPLATDDFVRTIESGAIVGTQFTRVVPDFVNQQESIRSGNTLRDEVNRRRLERANLSWASAGLDTGTPGYTLNHTPQPHNEGNFTTLGRVRRGMEVVDRIELGDRVLSARMVR